METNLIFEEPIRAHNEEPPYRVVVQWRNGNLLADEPTTVGGQDSGPDPYTLLLASLASCTLSTLRMYMQRKQWLIPDIQVEVNMFQEKEASLTTTIIRNLYFPDTITEEQRERLLYIAEQCPVSKLLKNSIQIKTSDGNSTPR